MQKSSESIEAICDRATKRKSKRLLLKQMSKLCMLKVSNLKVTTHTKTLQLINKYLI